MAWTNTCSEQILGGEVKTLSACLGEELLPTRGEAPPPSLLLPPLRLHDGGVEGDVRQDAKLYSSVDQVRLWTNKNIIRRV